MPGIKLIIVIDLISINNRSFFSNYIFLKAQTSTRQWRELRGRCSGPSPTHSHPSLSLTHTASPQSLTWSLHGTGWVSWLTGPPRVSFLPLPPPPVPLRMVSSFSLARSPPPLAPTFGSPTFCDGLGGAGAQLASEESLQHFRFRVCQATPGAGDEGHVVPERRGVKSVIKRKAEEPLPLWRYGC